MKVIKVTPRGYCRGVVDAINIVKNARKQYPNYKITVLGMLVHNQLVVNELSALGIDFVDDTSCSRLELLDHINEGIVVFTAHGVSKEVRQKAKEKNLICVDATCVQVAKVHQLVKEYLNLGYEIGYIGKKNHPESEAILGYGKHVHLIENESDCLNLPQGVYFFTNQTTLSSLDVTHLYDVLQNRFDDCVIADKICQATYERQKAVLELKEADVLIVVGDPRSHNTAKLAQLGQKNCPIVIKAADINDVKSYRFEPEMVVAVTSGASTPTYVTQEIIQYLEMLFQ